MKNSLVRILSLARLVFVDGLRRYALIGLLLFALAAQAGGLLFFDFIPRDIGRATNDFLFSVVWFAGLIFLFFHGVHAVAWDDGRRVIHTFLARPVARFEYVLGMFSGLAALLFLLNVILGVIGWAVLSLVQNSVTEVYFQQLSLPFYLLASLGLFFIELMILSVILFLAGAIRGPFPVLLVTLAYFFTCSGLPVVREALGSGANQASDALLLSLRGLTAVFPDFGRLDFKILVTTDTLLPSWSSLLLIFSSAGFYIAMLLWFGAYLYQKRDLQ